MAKGPRSSRTGSVAIVVVNWNGFEETAECLSCLKEMNRSDCSVIVVDNGSTDGSGERLAAEFDGYDFVFADENDGFGSGCNHGIEVALEMGVEYVCLLNNDARLRGEDLSELIAVERETEARIVGATITHEDGTVVNPSPSHFPDMLFYSGYRSNLPIGSGSADPSEDERWFESDRIEGAGVLFTSDLLRERYETTGRYIDDSVFMYCEEIELALWCREHGESSVVATEAIVEHDSDASSSRAFQMYYLTRNRVLIGHRYLEVSERIAFDLVYPITRLALAGRRVLNGEREQARAILAGLVDGYLHVDGQTR